ncbi:antiholin-like murein hydrolase modulator LrgA [Vagococcus sp. DIV0080]|jgi:holin-like protein|uniref:Antiholin-like murein hydrolase modulator LrgA n=1 Tax=Candidatus Vagococcus giribetii TaxID=2230876 RepID=A0ABS3HQ82_9ENTE|nr:antiholin-like murein hydrolase modulator LrgA [Vagococcus sp. DIV0080]MBO0475505.1 antiholin-like murein hydrolase modulator LrgA [Vagococcus sp. DIV0080]
MEKKKVYGFLEQAFIYALILLIANGIASISPIPLPPSLIGMVLLFLALCLNIIKLEQVEGLGNNLSKIISFLFVPSGISLITSLDIMAKYGVQIMSLIFIGILVLFVTIGYSSTLLLKVRESFKSGKGVEAKTRVESVKEVL